MNITNKGDSIQDKDLENNIYLDNHPKTIFEEVKSEHIEWAVKKQATFFDKFVKDIDKYPQMEK